MREKLENSVDKTVPFEPENDFVRSSRKIEFRYVNKQLYKKIKVRIRKELIDLGLDAISRVDAIKHYVSGRTATGLSLAPVYLNDFNYPRGILVARIFKSSTAKEAEQIKRIIYEFDYKNGEWSIADISSHAFYSGASLPILINEIKEELAEKYKNLDKYPKKKKNKEQSKTEQKKHLVRILETKRFGQYERESEL